MLLTTSEIIETSWRVYTKNWRQLFIYMALLFIPSFAVMILGLFGIYLDSVIPSFSAISDIILVIISICSFIFYLWVSAGLTLALSDISEAKTPGFYKGVLSHATSVFWPFIITSILVGIIIIGGTLLFIIPGIIFAVWYVFAAYAAILDNQSGVAALKASKKLVIGRWWSIAVRLFLPSFLFGLSASIIHGIISQLVSYLTYESLAFSIVNTTVGAIVSALLMPLTIGAMVLLYNSAKQNPHVSEPAPPMAK